jgi:putative lipoic acid-binding regulatory protein
MELNQKTEDFYNRLREQLSNNTLWPSQYLYKFILPADDEKVTLVKQAFENQEAQIETKSSSNGNYISVSVKVKMKNPDAVIEKYLEVSYIEGIISL